jgi:hypothetical protein
MFVAPFKNDTGNPPIFDVGRVRWRCHGAFFSHCEVLAFDKAVSKHGAHPACFQSAVHSRAQSWRAAAALSRHKHRRSRRAAQRAGNRKRDSVRGGAMPETK